MLFKHCRYATIYAYKHNNDIDMLAPRQKTEAYRLKLT